MDAKSFIVGTAGGAFIVAAAGWLLGSNNVSEVNSNRGLEIKPAIIPDANPPDSVIPGIQEPQIAATQDTTEQPTIENSSADSVSQWPANLREDLEAEQKDDGWAYYMEQTLLQYLGSHSSIAQFDISRIECRTTKCQIEVIGYDESTVPVWQQVMYDIRHQPWSEFGQYGSSHGTVDDRLIIVGTLHKLREDD